MAKQSKRDLEKVKAAEHKARLVEAKRKLTPSLIRHVDEITVKPTILIYCEGKNTEPSYFRQFKISTASVIVYGEGKNTLSLVKEAQKLAKQSALKGFPFEQVWCVFDADPKADNPKQLENFNQAVSLSNRLGFGTAYSNQAFEYWLLLHFEDHQGGAISRADYHEKLNKYLQPFGITYDGQHSKIITREIYDVLFEEIKKDRQGKPITRTDLATKRAQRIYDLHSSDHRHPGDEESSTTVYKLVEILREIK
jgi:hypothetical protein